MAFVPVFVTVLYVLVVAVVAVVIFVAVVVPLIDGAATRVVRVGGCVLRIGIVVL